MEPVCGVIHELLEGHGCVRPAHRSYTEDRRERQEQVIEIIRRQLSRQDESALRRCIETANDSLLDEIVTKG